ncbi:MBL fold metallo-hydrolase [Paenibacillus allorhizosphaerae]|uniref:Ribonuclease J n=1 Tax=Paenibacillus allorhizosphaerae TaxID=2849866 RepID=A0ABM8VAI4_9BACL|nr:MBL fold metallo-hydrolase [Paenibacillus allorhizosphaerae]CAG7616508.1 Ribonuclease J [Paenibacillus allorhizosphaerae]
MREGQLTFFGGAGKSGGVQVLYGKGKQAVLFDFGVEHSSLLFPKQTTLYEPVGATSGREIRQFLLGGMTAPLLKLYDPEQIKGIDPAIVRRVWNNREFPQYERINLFIGHMHTDHIGVLPYAHPDLPVYMNHDSYALYRGIVAGGHYPDTAARIEACEDLSVIDFGEFTIQIVEMDHNATGAAGLIIESGDHKIAYTGDWRRQGKHPEKIDRFIELCRSKQIDVLITEGTRLPADPAAVPAYQQPEDALLNDFSQLVGEAEGFVYLQMSPRDLERMANMIAIAMEKGRKIVMESSHALIWHAANREGLRILEGHPALNATIKVMDATVTDGMTVPYETVALEEVAEHKDQYLYFFKFPDLAQMIELETLGGLQGCSHFIQSDYSVKVDHKDVAKFLKSFGITGHTLNNGGHAHPDAISDLVERIAPKAVITLHSPHPRSLNTRGIKAYFPEKGETVSVASIIEAASVGAAQ